MWNQSLFQPEVLKGTMHIYWLHRYTFVLHQNAGEVFRERSVIGGFGGNFPFRQIHVKIVLEDESTLLMALPFSDKKWSNPDLLPAGGQSGWGPWPGSVWEAEIITGLGGVLPSPLPSPHTWLDHPVSGLRPTRQPVAIPSQTRPRKGVRDYWERIYQTFPPGLENEASECYWASLSWGDIKW